MEGQKAIVRELVRLYLKRNRRANDIYMFIVHDLIIHVNVENFNEQTLEK